MRRGTNGQRGNNRSVQHCPMGRHQGSSEDQVEPAANADRPQRLTAAALTGMGWSYSTSIAIGIIQFIYVAVMSRLLAPRAFGVYAIAMLCINMGNSFARMGLAQALIQRPSISRDDIRAASTAGIAFGFILFLLLWVVAPWIGYFFREPQAIGVVRLMGVHFIFLGFGVTSHGLLRRELRFRQLSIAHVASYALGYGIIGISMALAGMGIWSLALGVLSAHLFQALFQYGCVRHPLRPTLRLRRFSHLYSFGTRVSLVGLLEFLGRQLDTFAVGRYTTTGLLGQYSRAFILVNLPLSQHLSQSITRVIFPGLSKIQQNPRRLKRAYISVLTLGALLLFPVGAGMAVAAREIVLVVLGEQWDIAVTLVPFFSVAVVFNIMTKFAELVCEARAELNKVLCVQMGYIVVLAAAYIAVSGFGEPAPFAAVLAVSEILRHIAFSTLLWRVAEVRPREVVQAYAPALVTTAGVALAVLVGRQAALIDGFPVVGVLAIEILLAAFVLALCTRFNPFSGARRELWERLRVAGVLQTPNGSRQKLVRLLLGQEPPSLGVTPRR